MSALVEIRGLQAGYGGPPVLSGVDLRLDAGEFVGILGPNACGKSTLIRVLSGILAPEKGSVAVAGLDAATTSPRELARRVAVLAQSTDIPFPFTGEEIVTMGRFPHVGRFGALGDADREAVRTALEETDTLSLADRLVTEVSGGERQRLLLARALAQRTPLVLLDEATASMDIHRKIDAFDLLAAKNRKGTTVLAVMHDLNLAALYCKRLVMLRNGRVHADGPTEAVFTRENLEAVFETPVEIARHPANGRPQAFFLPRNERT